MLRKEASSTIFWVFGMTRRGIEPRSPRPWANTITIMLMSGMYVCINSIWHWITYKGWFAKKSNQPTNQLSNQIKNRYFLRKKFNYNKHFRRSVWGIKPKQVSNTQIFVSPITWCRKMHWLNLCWGVRPGQTRVLDMTLNWIWWCGSSSRALENGKNSLIVINPKSTLTQDGGTRKGLIYGSKAQAV